MDVVDSVNGVPIRLTEERWRHIVDNKPYMSAYYENVISTIEHPMRVIRGYAGALVAISSVGRRRYLNVVYREISQDDGFIVTAFVSTKLNKGTLTWPKARS
jgi:hypothetical protein